MNRTVLKLFAWAIALSLIGLPIVGVLNGWFAQDRWPIRNLQVEAEFNHVGAEQIRVAMTLVGGIAATHFGPRYVISIGLALAGVSLSTRGSWTISLVDGSEILLGQRDIDEHLKRFLDVFPRLAAGRGTNSFARADLRYANGFAIRWLAAAPTPAPGAASPTDKPAPGKPPATQQRST